MKRILQLVTDWTASKSGMWTVIAVWTLAAALFSMAAPSANEYKLSSIQALPDEAASMEAAEKVKRYFPEDSGVPAIIVLNSKKGEIEEGAVGEAVSAIQEENIKGLTDIPPFSALPEPVRADFFSEDRTAAVIPVLFDEQLKSKEYKQKIDLLTSTAEKESPGLEVRVTGPAGIAADTISLFSRADIVLLLSTVGLILLLLIVIYRSPLLALIPLLASALVYAVTDRILGLYGKAGLEMSSQSLSIMTILLFAAVTDYSLFVLSRFREELKLHESKYEAMKMAMRGAGEPVFFSGGTVLAAMVVLFLAAIGDYRNFAPLFATVMAVIMLASVTLVPALFTLFGRKSFWPKIPKAEKVEKEEHGIWGRLGRFVVSKPFVAGGAVMIFLIAACVNVMNMKYELNTLKTFPDDMPSLEGYKVIEEKFSPGDLAPTTVLFEGEGDPAALSSELKKQDGVASVSHTDATEDGKAHKFTLSLAANPYEASALAAVSRLREKAPEMAANAPRSWKVLFRRRDGGKAG